MTMRNEANPAAKLAMWVIHGAMMMSPLFYAVVALVIGRGTLGSFPADGMAGAVMVAVPTAMMMTMGVLTWKGAVPIGPATIDTLRALQSRMVIVDVMFESAAIIGLVYVLVGGPWAVGLFLFGLSLLAMGWMIPQIAAAQRRFD